MLVLSALVLCCYLPYLILVVTRGEAFTSCAIPFAVVVAASVPAFLFSRSASLCRPLKVLRAVYIAGMSFYVITFAAFAMYIGVCSHEGAGDVLEVVGEENDALERDLILVFGCRTYGYTPGDQLKCRLDVAYELLDELDGSVCVVSGGEGKNEGVAEAYSMCEYLVGRGIARERIYTEAASRNTYENIELSKKVIEANGIEYDRIIGVSSDFHIPRVKYLFDYYGLDAVTVSAPSRDAWQFFMSIVREYMAYVKLFLVTVI